MPNRFTLDAADIGIGATEICVAMPVKVDPQPIWGIGTFIADLLTLARWLEQCGVTPGALESSGV